jgi:phosphonate transport system substrate-binding protein
MRSKKLVMLVAALVLLSVSYTPWLAIVGAQEAAPEARASLILGDIDENPVKAVKKLQPLADYLAAQLAEQGIESGEVMIAPDMETMIDWLASGQVDILFDSPYPSMVVINEANAQPVLRRWKDGVSVYHSVFFTLADSGLETIEDLQGQIIALDAPQSTSGFMLPKSHLLELGLKVDEKTRPTSRVKADEIGYVFSTDDETTIQWVISGKVAAGVVDNETFVNKIPEETRNQMVILGETVEVPRQLMVVRPDMDAGLLEALTTILVAMDETEAALPVLEQFDTTQFDFFPEGPEAALENLQAMFDLAQQ